LNTQEKIKYSSSLKRDEVALYLNELSKGFLQDHLSLRSGSEEIMMTTSDIVRLEIEAKEKKDEYKVYISLSWNKPKIKNCPPLIKGVRGCL
jgi:amphi-Trp domain-containing protein